MNIAPIKKWSIRKSEGKPLFQSGKNNKVEKRLYILNNFILIITMADRDQKYCYF
tara:strand:+ start:196 stop:360 length:165 start_codon:yes stop_codon:yes gene_type:complete